MLAIWFLVPLPFLKPVWTSGSSQFTYCWSLAWRFWALLACAAAAAKSLQSCLTLCYPRDGSPPGSPIPGILQAEWNCVVVWAFFGMAFLWDWNENWPFPVLWPLLNFQIYWHIECSTFTASSFRIWNSSTGILSPPLALFIVMLSKAHLTSQSRILALGEWSHHRSYLGE